MKALCIHPSSPRGRFVGTAGVDFPDTQLYGYNHLASFGIDADLIGRDDALPRWLQKSRLGKLLGFRVRHLLLYFRARRYDIVFGGALLYLMPLKKLFGGKARYVLFNIELTRILRANAHRPLRSWFIHSLLDSFAGIVCLSHTQKSWLEERYPFLAKKLYVVPLGVDTWFYQPVFEGRGDIVLSVGGDQGRDYPTLLAAAALLPDTRFEIVCRAHTLDGKKIPPNVQVFYDLSFTELTEKYRTARMMVIPTHDDSYLDGSDCSGQTVLLDAMANGLPVIVSRKQYLTDYVREGTDAHVVDCYDPTQIVSAIQSLESESIRIELAKNARMQAEIRFSTKIMAEGLAGVFREVAGTSQRNAVS